MKEPLAPGYWVLPNRIHKTKCYLGKIRKSNIEMPYFCWCFAYGRVTLFKGHKVKKIRNTSATQIDFQKKLFLGLRAAAIFQKK